MNKELKPWKIDVPVLCIFFARPEQFKETFEAVRQARPSTLLLWQDGPRENRPDDIENIAKCREIAEKIDWDCTVYRNYHEKNMGCDPSTFLSHKWAFTLVDKCIIIEDDVVASQDFFPYCKELLDRYEFDTRINKICGMSQVKGFECPYSYFFSSTGSVWGWATWKRVADTWDEEYSFLNDKYNLGLLNKLKTDKSYKNYEDVCRKHAATGRAHWETIESYSRFLNNQLCIIPAVNMIHNIGLGFNSTHSNIQLECVPKKVREAMYCEAEPMEIPLKHQEYVIENLEYKEQLFKITGSGHPLIAFKNKLEGRLRRIMYKFSHK